jgi:hypothetical protein
MTTQGHVLSAFAGELLARARVKLGGAAFGRLTQQLVVAALKRLYPGLHENPGAGTPDCHWSEQGTEWAWEIKSTSDEGISLGSRDIEGLRAERSRVVVLDVAFPARLWVLDAMGLQEGLLRPAAHAQRHRLEEANRLAEVMETILRRCDVDILTSEQQAKALVREAASWPWMDLQHDQAGLPS